MIIVRVEASESNIMVVKLTHVNMKLDPRYMSYYGRPDKFRFSVKGRILTITRTDQDEDWPFDGWKDEFFLRAYFSTEVIPDFTPTVCTYWGLEDEHAPPS